MSNLPTKYFFRQRNRNRVFDTVVAALEDAKISRSDLARKLGMPRSQISRQLSGPANWTCDTISDLLFAIEAELEYRVARWADYGKPNQQHPANSATFPAKPVDLEGASTTFTNVSFLSGPEAPSLPETAGAPTRVTVKHAPV